jgi:hypothetical protein
MNYRLLLQITTLTMLLSSCAELGIPAGPAGPTGGAVVERGSRGASAKATITAAEARRLAVQYGLTGYRGLPPGIQRNLARGKPLPPGLQRRVVPGGMLNQLPVVEGQEWHVAGRDLILVAVGTLIVIEILNDVFF